MRQFHSGWAMPIVREGVFTIIVIETNITYEFPWVSETIRRV
jgi:hypothetical protein